jgi:lipoyl(octanoyl) transferase
MRQDVIFRDLSVIEYGEAWDLQERLLQENLAVKSVRSQPRNVQQDKPMDTSHYLLFCEHPPVYTLGKSGKMEHVLITEAERAERGIAFYATNRGGDITFHGPGQLVGYPVLDLEKFFTDIGRYLRNLEEVVIRTLAHYHLHGERSPGETGVWIDPDKPGRERKICAMGVRCSRWVTIHGFALNVNTDLGYFDSIVPCGIRGKQVTSIGRELGRSVPMQEVQEIVKQEFEHVFECRLVSSAPGE